MFAVYAANKDSLLPATVSCLIDGEYHRQGLEQGVWILARKEAKPAQPHAHCLVIVHTPGRANKSL
jgi:hypothetical protein